MTKLTPTDAADLARLERTIQTGMVTFREVGAALCEIRDRKLYKVTHKSFDAYLKARWGFSRGRGYQLIAAAHTTVDISCERQARELRGFSEEVQEEALASLENPTAAALRERLEELSDADIDAIRGEERQALERRKAVKRPERDRVDQCLRLLRRALRVAAGIEDGETLEERIKEAIADGERR